MAINLFITKVNQISPHFNDQSPKKSKKKQYNHHQIKLRNHQLNQFKKHQIQWLYHQNHTQLYQYFFGHTLKQY